MRGVPGRRKASGLRNKIFEILKRGQWLTSTMLAERLGVTGASITKAIKAMPDEDRALIEERSGQHVVDVVNSTHVREYRMKPKEV